MQKTFSQGTNRQPAILSARHSSDEAPKYKSVSLKIPVCLKLHKQDLSGFTKAINLDGLRLICSAVVRSSTPLALQFSFGANMCYLNVSGQVVSCLPTNDRTTGQYVLTISFAAIREFERNILRSAIHELQRNTAAQGKSLLTIHVSKDSLAEEVAKLAAGTLGAEPSADVAKRTRKRRMFTPDPEWVLELKGQIAPHWDAVVQCQLVQETSAGTLSLKQMRAWLTQLYPFIESFPKWLALNITKTQDPRSAGFLSTTCASRSGTLNNGSTWLKGSGSRRKNFRASAPFQPLMRYRTGSGPSTRKARWPKL